MKKHHNSLIYIVLFLIVISNTLFSSGFKNKLFLTYEESLWIKKTKVVKIAVPSHKKPYSYFENGKYIGFNVDVLNKITQITKLKFEVQGYKEKFFQTAFATTGAAVFQGDEANGFVTAPFHKSGMCFAVDPNNEILYNILQKSIKKISKEEYKKINDKWFASVIDTKEKGKSGFIETKLDLTKEEQEWLNKNPVLKIAVMSYWPVDEDGSNIHYRLLDLISKYSNLNIVPVGFTSWDTGYNQASNGTNISSILGLSWSAKRENSFFYTPPYDFTPCYLITKEGNKEIKSFSDLKNKTVYLKKSSITLDMIKQEPSAKTIEMDTNEEMLDALSAKNEGDAILSYFADFKKLKEKNLKVVDTIYEKHGEVSIGVNKKYPELYSIISKAFALIPKSELTALRSKGKINFSKDEKEWLNKNLSLKFTYSPDWKPLEWTNEIGEYTGIVSDLVKVIQAKSNIRLQAVHSQSLEEGINNLRAEKAAIFTALDVTKERKKFLNFTKNNILSTPYVFISKKELSFPNGFSDAKDKKIGVIQGYAAKTIITEAKKDIELKEIPSIKEAFERIDNGKLDILILNALSAQYYLKILEYDEEMYISYKTLFNLDLKIAVNKDMPKEVLSILDKSIESLSKKQVSDIINKWIQIKVKAKTDWVFIGKITGVIILIVILLFLNNRKLKSLVEAKTADIQKQKKELENLLTSFDKNVISSKTDLKGVITDVSEAFCKISGYKEEELIGQPHSIVRHPDMSKTTFAMIWKSLKREAPITKEIKNMRKDGSFYWVLSRFAPDYDTEGKLIGYSSIKHDITDKKAVEELSANLEIKVEERTRDLEATKKEVEQILASILLPVLITDKQSRKILYANKYAEVQYDTTLEEMIGSGIEELYTTKGQSDELVEEMKRKGYIESLEQTFVTHAGKEFTALLSVIPITYKNHNSYIGMTTDITKQKKIEEEIRQMHKHTRDSIEYASLIQHALIPERSTFENFFPDFFTYWQPKDIVGGDVYLFEQLSDKESLLLVIDCTGHGVPGAFVTMLVKAIERQVTALIHGNDFINVSPAWILSYFNKTIKKLLKQESEESISNAGFDGGVLYYNKEEKIVKFSGAETPLFYFDENGEFKTVKGNRHSIGYKKSDADYEFKEHVFEAKEGMQFYLTTDGYLDQNGGEKDFPFGKKRFGNLLKENYQKPFKDQEKILVDELITYQGNTDRNDDVTVIGIKI